MTPTHLDHSRKNQINEMKSNGNKYKEMEETKSVVAPPMLHLDGFSIAPYTLDFD